MKSVVVLVAVLLVAGCTAVDGPEPVRVCGSPVRTDALPEWARAGFSWDGAGTPHVYGAKGDILAIVFGARLSSPPEPGRNNKILWVSRPDITGDPLVIAATLDGTAEPVRQEVGGGPGPSIVDLPRPGCWRFTLAWSGFTDTMELNYQAGTPPARSRPPSS
ncbi:hypothetical protein M1L60_40495 [Actinoplanes sp. TRM 88003]|uniref:DUF4871 domain-containing protein n=1 Tax=Paractinoplanes aksuensis TaxID=2939490 RepID=A0ABT1E153_9ACTN|nr:hypothetical protein [Actinoplanes aksuensis]MCO8276879.1 hypothetical protein [Actinoplanes aksuensis]